MVDAINHGRCIAVMPRNCCDHHPASLENLPRRRVFERYGYVMSMQGDRCGEIIQVREGALGSEQQMQKFTRARKVGVLTLARRARRAPHVEDDGSGT